jgi:phosphoribosylformimino-5-aminoimidazole carboxamide ribonucleotide (ProFAR) isomerase
LGAEQIIVGTRAFTAEGIDESFLAELNRAVGAERTIIAIDVKDGRIAVRGWRDVVDITPGEVIQSLEPYCAGFLCTYVDKEGMLQGTDLPLFLDLKRRTRREVIAAGGITTMTEVKALVDAGIPVALGMAIYTGALDLGELRSLNRAG